MRSKSIRIIDTGPIVIIEPMTRRASAWIKENIGPDNGYQPYYPTIIVEGRYVDAILEGMAEDGIR